MPRSGGVLEGDPDAPPLRAACRLVESATELNEPRVESRAAVRARMDHDEREAQSLRALELVDEGGDGTRPLPGVRRREIDQVVRVGERPEPGQGERGAEVRRLGVSERSPRPAELVLEENLDDAA